jgi:hypothetical protein
MTQPARDTCDVFSVRTKAHGSVGTKACLLLLKWTRRMYTEVPNQILFLKTSHSNISNWNTGTWQIQNDTAVYCIACQNITSALNGQPSPPPPTQAIQIPNSHRFVRIVILLLLLLLFNIFFFFFFQIHTRIFQFFLVLNVCSLIKTCPFKRAAAVKFCHSKPVFHENICTLEEVG